MEWTKAQAEAISADGENILVSAAAGSGKTAVLVERIIRRLLPQDGSDGMDIDRMLVVTFTEAAAAEMKEKILSAIRKSNHPKKRRQLRLADRAMITTIDSFCYRTVKNNFPALGIDPNLGIADKAQSELIKDEAFDELLEDLYKQGNRRFLELAEMYSSNRSDEGLKDIVKRIYLFAQSFPEPKKWLIDAAKKYRCRDISKNEYIRSVLLRLKGAGKKAFGAFSALLKDMRDECGLFDNDGEYFDISEIMEGRYGKLYADIANGMHVSNELSQLNLEEGDAWDNAYDIYHDIFGENVCYLKMNRRYDVKGGSDEEKNTWLEFYDRRCGIWTDFKESVENTAVQTKEEIETERRSLYKQAVYLVWLINKFTKYYTKRKERRNVMEFSDIEHLTYRLFKENKAVCEEYRNRFDTILIDEYQDTNELQDSIFTLISRDNIFMVGDLKQSIYRFRGGDPTVFSSKSDRYKKHDGGMRIALSQNFRSRMEILDSVNDIFSSVMSKSAGEVEYKGDELLTREKDYYEENGCSHISELHIIERIKGSESDDETERSNDAIEAEYVAEQIGLLMKSGYKVLDKETGEYRSLRLRDITILASSIKNISDIYAEALSQAGIDSYVETNGYFKRREIQLILNLISVIDNHRLDIPLISIMLSPIGGFNEEELAKIRCEYPKTDTFFDALSLYAEKYEKSRNFVERLNKWRGYKKYKSVANIIWTLYEETGIYDFLGALEGGEEAQLNLKLLYERAKKYEESGFKGLFNFIRYIENIREKSDDMGGAKMIGESHDVVRIMTIHKSKGLEFPVVFVVGCAKKFPAVKGGRVQLHKDGGMGLMYANPKESIYMKTTATESIYRLNTREERSESMRRLYVGLTRAKEKMFVTGVIAKEKEEDFEKCYDEYNSMTDCRGVMSPDTAIKAKNMMDWILPAAMKSDNWKVVRAQSGSVKKDEVKEEIHEEYDTEFLYNSVSKLFESSYRYIESIGLPSKTSVTEIKRHRNEKMGISYSDTCLVRHPEFIKTEKKSGAEIGTIYHEIMSYIDIHISPDNESVRREIDRISDMGLIDKQDAEEVREEYIVNYLNSSLGKRMRESRELYREVPFEIEIPVSVYDEDLSDGEYGSDTILLQGIVDCYFVEEDGGVVLLDYKTDKCENTPEAKAKKKAQYSIQLDTYARAIEKITKKVVKDKFLYLFSVQDVV